ncbi:hypothetical protein AB0D49_04245 [Streptomyces sp. NPDC048290]|uniref:hypothetical protein n=1 Tax=Streptomyces sp. NPDC048290 TaxID=3155811 RepID=UPI00343718B3
MRAIFRDERTQELPELQRERLWAAGFAAIGVDYDYPTMPLGSVVARKERALLRAVMADEPAPATGALCCRCKRWTYMPMPVRHIECPSGPGVTLYACPNHAVAFLAGPTEEDLSVP